MKNFKDLVAGLDIERQEKINERVEELVAEIEKKKLEEEISMRVNRLHRGTKE